MIKNANVPNFYRFIAIFVSFPIDFEDCNDENVQRGNHSLSHGLLSKDNPTLRKITNESKNRKI